MISLWLQNLQIPTLLPNEIFDGMMYRLLFVCLLFVVTIRTVFSLILCLIVVYYIGYTPSPLSLFLALPIFNYFKYNFSSTFQTIIGRAFNMWNISTVSGHCWRCHVLQDHWWHAITTPFVKHSQRYFKCEINQAFPSQISEQNLV